MRTLKKHTELVWNKPRPLLCWLQTSSLLHKDTSFHTHWTNQTFEETTLSLGGKKKKQKLRSKNVLKLISILVLHLLQVLIGSSSAAASLPGLKHPPWPSYSSCSAQTVSFTLGYFCPCLKQSYNPEVAFFHHPPISPSILTPPMVWMVSLYLNTGALWLWLTERFPACMFQPIYNTPAQPCLRASQPPDWPGQSHKHTLLSATSCLYSLRSSPSSLQCGTNVQSALWRLLI